VKRTKSRRQRASVRRARSVLVLKLGGELLESAADLERTATGIAGLAQRSTLVIVHGGGREIDAALATAGIPKQQVDGLRVTDSRTLDVVVSVLAGAINTRLVAALRGAGARPVGLTGADTSVVTVRRSPPISSVAGVKVDLGLVGSPINNGTPHLLTDLLACGYLPVVACVGATRRGELLNVNADTLASHLAAELKARRLVIAGGTSGVLDDSGHTIDRLTGTAAARLVREGRRRRVDRQRTRHFIREACRRIWPAARLHMDCSMKTTLDDIRARELRHVVQTYKRQPVAFVRGNGARLFDTEGREYLDFISGIGVTSLGHAHPGLTAAIADQAATLVHTSNLYYHPFQAEAAARLAQLSGLPRAFFCNSGTEAVEACLKFARRYWYSRGATARTEFIALEGAFAGRTFGSLSVTHDEHYRAPFAPLLPGVTFVAPDDPAALIAAASERTAAIIAEPIQGEGGIRPMSAEFASAINDVCSRTGTLYIADEVQTGLGRTGRPFYFEALGLRPDLISVGKALGGGIPVGAALLSERVSEAVCAGDHGSTYGGNLLGTRAAAFFLTQLMEGGLLEHVKTVGMHLERRLRAIALKYPTITEVRGAGLMRGIQLNTDAMPIVDAAREQGLLVNRTDEKVVRLLPPLTIETAEIDRAAAMLDAVFARVSQEVQV